MAEQREITRDAVAATVHAAQRHLTEAVQGAPQAPAVLLSRDDTGTSSETKDALYAIVKAFHDDVQVLRTRLAVPDYQRRLESIDRGRRHSLQRAMEGRRWPQVGPRPREQRIGGDYEY